ncbi:uncharacterized protein LOC113343911 [Papaver somniferum]|uniref:uncharacterized protein LOC113343911 n=1 Tax=Papaver somniferum TaxID=3469 RepID=UPI000E6FEB10|nr:uncharacterized protein LOC113343911 [Papaver somniferum]
MGFRTHRCRFCWQDKEADISIQKIQTFIHLAACIMHFIWKHRCRIFFNNITPNHNYVIHQVRSYIAYHHLGHTSDNHQISLRNNISLTLTWKPPPLQFLKINIDASFNYNSLLAGIGIITRTSTGAYVMGRGTVRRAINVQQAEAWALLESMQLAASNGWTHVIFETDNLSNSTVLQQQSTLSHWQSMPLLKKCMNICNINPVWSCVFVHKSCNKTEDALAKTSRKLNVCGE